jgi:K+-sensing histidine kinase KdpD
VARAYWAGLAVAGGVTAVMDRHLAVRYALGLAVAAAGITAVTAVIWVLGGLFPPQRWAGLYLLAVLPVASKFGFMPALMTAALSALVFDFLFSLRSSRWRSRILRIR